MSTILIMAVGFGLGLWYAKGKPDPARQLWRDARKVATAVCKTAQNIVRECQRSKTEED